MEPSTSTSTVLKGLPAILALFMPAEMADVVMVGGCAMIGSCLSLYFEEINKPIFKQFLMVIFASLLGLVASWTIAKTFFNTSNEAPWMVALAIGFYFNSIPKYKQLLEDKLLQFFNKADKR